MRKTTKVSWLAIAIMGIAFLPSPASAELPPDVYERLQEDAPEVIGISVKRVFASRKGALDFSGDRDMTVFASVVSVTRTASGLKAGDEIVIRYVAKNPDAKMAGPSPIPKLEEKMEYPAWLSKSAEGHYEPAARGYSFSVLR
ncbi:MAG: hypothetical protein ABJQ29_10995 [Luteolibacter sp.]